MARDEALSGPPLPAGNVSGPGVEQRPVTAAWAHFNFFQRMMLRWRELHPYNPVHVVRVPVALDAQRLRACIAERLESLGLTGLSVDQGRWRYRFEGGPAAVELSVLAAGDDAQGLLSRTIEREFNRPFVAAAREQPFRFIAIDEGAAFQLVLVYDHYVASGDSIARLLTHLACTLAEPDARAGAAGAGLPLLGLPRHAAAPSGLGAEGVARPAAHGGRRPPCLACAPCPDRRRPQRLPLPASRRHADRRAAGRGPAVGRHLQRPAHGLPVAGAVAAGRAAPQLPRGATGWPWRRS